MIGIAAEFMPVWLVFSKLMPFVMGTFAEFMPIGMDSFTELVPVVMGSD